MDSQVLTYLPLVSPVATLIVVIVGVLFNSRHVDLRISGLRSHMDGRFNSMDQLFQESLRRVEEVMDARLSRIEQELHLE